MLTFFVVLTCGISFALGFWEEWERSKHIDAVNRLISNAIPPESFRRKAFYSTLCGLKSALEIGLMWMVGLILWIWIIN